MRCDRNRVYQSKKGHSKAYRRVALRACSFIVSEVETEDVKEHIVAASLLADSPALTILHVALKKPHGVDMLANIGSS